MRARIASLSRWANEDPRPTAIRGQQGLRAKFLREIAAEHPGLPADELQRRADAAYRAHMGRLSLASSKARTRQDDDGVAALVASASSLTLAQRAKLAAQLLADVDGGADG